MDFELLGLLNPPILLIWTQVLVEVVMRVLRGMAVVMLNVVKEAQVMARPSSPFLLIGKKNWRPGMRCAQYDY